jgi:zinc protease
MNQAAEINRKATPAFGKPIQLLVKEPTFTLLNNGIETYCIDAGDEEVCRLDIIITAGSAYQNKSLVATSTGKLLKEGTEKLTSSAIAEKIDKRGAYLDVSVTKDTAVVTLYSLNKYLEELLPLLGDMLTNASFPDEELNIHIERRRQEFLTNYEKVKYRALLEFNKLVFGEQSAYGQHLRLEDFNFIERNDLLQFYRNNYIPESAYIIVSGKINDKLVGLIDKYVGNNWIAKGQTNPVKRNFAEPAVPEKKLFVKQGALQSAIRVGRPIISKTHPDYNAFILLNTILGGYFGSRLMSNLREDKGYTYGVSSFVANYINAGYFGISTEVNAKYTRAAVDEICIEMKKLREQKVGTEELQLVKNYIYGTFLRNFDGPFALAERFRSVKDFGLNFDFYKKSLDEILKINAEELIETANKYFNPDEMIQLVVGKMD